MIKLFELAKLMTMSVHNRQTHESCTTRSGPKAHGDTHHALPLTIIYSINSHISKGLRNSKAVTVSSSLKEELKYWRFLDSWKECLPWRDEKHYSVKLCSDASNSGWGGILSLPEGKLQSRDYWKSEDRSSIKYHD